MTPTSRSRLVRVLARTGITVAAIALFFFLRPDYASQLRLRYHISVTSRLLISDYLRQTPVRKLQIGTGSNNMAGWLNTDIEIGKDKAFLDATKPFPLPDRSFQYIFGEHVIEHIAYEQALFMLQECHRILAPGGKLRISTPNLTRFIELFQDEKTAEMRRFLKRKLEWHEWPETPDPECYILNLQMRTWGHEFVYTPKMLRASLEKAGFRDVKQFRPGESDDPALFDLEVRSKWVTADVDAYETMVFQAVRE